jgi:hypothetical protein
MWEDIKQISTTPRQIRNFGWLIGGFLILLGAYHYFFGEPALVYLVAIGMVIGIGAWVFPSLFRPVYWLWMLVAVVLGWIISRVILTVFFYVVLTPIGWIGRIFGKRYMSLGFDKEASTYWGKREQSQDPRACEKQF